MKKEVYIKPTTKCRKIEFENKLLVSSESEEEDKNEDSVWCEKHQRYEKSGSNHGIGGVFDNDDVWK